jgi:TRAP-type C4-dicarboxylate transport system substrate-binding protein
MLPPTLVRTLRAAAAAGALAALVVPGAAIAQQVTLRLHSFSAPQALDQTKHLNPWAEKVGKDSGGKLKVEVYPGMQLGGKASDLVQQLEDGVVDMIWTVAGFTPGRFPGLEGVELPFMNTGLSATQSPAVMEFAEKWLLNNEFKGIRIVSIHTTDAAIVHSVKKPIRTLEDWKGMKVRVAGRFIGETVKAYGGTPVGIALPGVYEALERGQVDAMLINWAITAPYRFYEVSKHHTNTAIFQGTLLTLISQKSYDKLPPDLKKAIDQNAGIEYAKYIGKIWDGETAPAIEATRKAGNNVFELSPAEKERWKKAAQPAYDIWIAEMNKLGRPGKQMFDDLLAITAKYGRK